MNRNEMKTAIAKFKHADVSIIKDDAMRAKAQKLQAKQKGFTLLELLVVITLLATIATAGLVAYEGIGENATDTAVANNLQIAESSLRNYRALEDAYPNQFDNLASEDGTVTAGTGSDALLAAETKEFFGSWAVDAADPMLAAVAGALEAVGIDEFQTIPDNTDMTGAIPNLAFNESAGFDASELELDYDEDTGLVAVEFDGTAVATGTDVALSIVPSNAGDGTTASACITVGGPSLSASFDATAALSSQNLNLINDAIDDDACTLVLALGIGKDVPGTTIDSRVAIGQVPTVGTTNVSPATSYARAIALFQVANDDDEDGTIQVNEVFSKARLVGVVDPEGRAIDTVIAAANAES